MTNGNGKIGNGNGHALSPNGNGVANGNGNGNGVGLENHKGQNGAAGHVNGTNGIKPGKYSFILNRFFKLKFHYFQVEFSKR